MATCGKVGSSILRFSKQAQIQQNSLIKDICRKNYYSYANEPFQPLDRQPQWMSAEEAVSAIKSNHTVYIHGTSATPKKLVTAMTNHGQKSGLKNVNVCHILTEGEGEYHRPEYSGIFRSNNLFLGPNAREAVAAGRADYTPIFLSEIPLLFERGYIKPDVSLIQVTPPDEHGFCSLGTCVVCTRAAIKHTKFIIGQVNPRMPRTFGDTMVHMSHFDALVEGEAEIPELKAGKSTEEECKIGELIAEHLVDDGATLQMGIGSIPDAVLAALKGHKDLGIHSEMFSDGVVDLVDCGAITNRFKAIQPGKIVGSFVMGSRRLFDFLHNNPFVVMMVVDFVNNQFNVARNPKMTAINSCIEVDLTGQVVSDSVGTKIYSGFGGQVDFLRGAAISLDGLGKPILAMSSTTSKGESKIVPTLKPGGGVVSTRAHVHYMVTEYGIAQLFGKNFRQRAHALIQIAHPNHREKLEKAAFEILKVMPSP